MSKTPALLIGCGAAVVFCGVVVIAAGALLLSMGQEPADVAITVEGPLTVSVGEEFTLTVVVQNQREKQPFELTDIDIADGYLENFLVLGTDPPAKSSMHVPLDNTRSFSFDHDVPAREAMRFDFVLRPTKAGLFRGDVDVCEGMRFRSTLLQTEVETGK